MQHTPDSSPLGHASRPLVYAHRGDRSRAGDNTIEAYTLAVEAGTDGVELDVRRTRDGVLILSHDDRLPDMDPFASLLFEDVREIAPHVPTLREALSVIPRHVFVNVEIKNFSFNAGYDIERTIVDETVDELREYDDPTRIVMSSFDPLSVQRCGVVGPEFLRGQLLLALIPVDAGITIATELGVEAIVPHMSHFKDDPATVTDQIKQANFRFLVWGVNTPDEVASMATIGADGIITDDPAMARKIFDQR